MSRVSTRDPFKIKKHIYMPNESVIPKQQEVVTRKIIDLMNKLPIPQAIEAWHDAGDNLHKRIDDNEKELRRQKDMMLTSRNAK